jgi:hypothetical protein
MVDRLLSTARLIDVEPGEDVDDTVSSIEVLCSDTVVLDKLAVVNNTPAVDGVALTGEPVVDNVYLDLV